MRVEVNWNQEFYVALILAQCNWITVVTLPNQLNIRINVEAGQFNKEVVAKELGMKEDKMEVEQRGRTRKEGDPVKEALSTPFASATPSSYSIAIAFLRLNILLVPTYATSLFIIRHEGIAVGSNPLTRT
ncbi:MAG: hypothetical protein QW796_03860 [Thermoproteota archaeon]